MTAYDLLLQPFVEFAFMRRALVACLALGLGCGPLGTLLVLRRMSLMGDAMSHALLPGAAVAFIVVGLSLPAMSLGAFVAALAVAALAGGVTRWTAQREDASFAAFYLMALAAGVMLISLYGNSVDLMRVLFGSVLAVDDAALLLVAGGTGIAPIRSVILDRLEHPDRRPATLVYSVRTPDEFAFAEESVTLAADGRLRLHATITRDDGPADQPARFGRVDAELLRAALPDPQAYCLVCGPAGFVQTVTATLEQLGVPRQRIVVER